MVALLESEAEVDPTSGNYTKHPDGRRGESREPTHAPSLEHVRRGKSASNTRSGTDDASPIWSKGIWPHPTSLPLGIEPAESQRRSILLTSLCRFVMVV